MKLSGYLTVKNAVKMDYPFEQSIKSLLGFCDEVIVVDSSNENDGTWDKLQILMNEHNNLNVFHVDVDWSAPNHGIFDGELKKLARKKCTGEYLWQQDSDEIVEPNIRPKINSIINQIESQNIDIVDLPVVEYWGSKGKIRVDVPPSKLRLSKNKQYITHGIPDNLKKIENGLLYAKYGTDGCNYLFSNKHMATVSFVTSQVEQIRQKGIYDSQYVQQYQQWFYQIIQHLPTVYHFSWYSIAAKILRYKYFWNDSWLSLYNEKKPEGYNPFFSDKSLNEVSDEEIKQLAIKLEQESGGHIFHAPWQGQKTNHIKLDVKIPEIMNEWCDKHKDC